jgi:hypothetical protein
MHPARYASLKQQEWWKDDEFPKLLVPMKPAFRAIGVGNTKGYQLVAEGHLTKVKIGSKSLITVESLRRFVAGLR